MSHRPNVVIIMTDQHQARCSEREGFPLDTTPYMDELARQGTWFNRAYSAAPLCVPARISMLTGRYPSAHGIRDNPTVLTNRPRYHRDLVDVLAGSGYATAMVGKNHSHLHRRRVDHWFPLDHDAGFWHRHASIEAERAFDLWLHELRHGVSEEPTHFPLECQGPWRAVSDALQWVSDDGGKAPFFLWLSFAEPHNPYQVPEPYFSLFPPEALPPVLAGREAAESKGFRWQFVSRLGRKGIEEYDRLLPRARSSYYGMLRLIDDQVRRFVRGLRDSGMLESTLILFIADHGDFVGEYGLMRKGPPLPEVLIRVPFFAYGMGVASAPNPHPAFVSIVDIMPTVCEAVGKPLPDGVQGRSLWPLVTGGPYPEQEFASAYAEFGFGGLEYTWADEPNYEKYLTHDIRFNCLNQYTQCGTMRMVRMENWKLVLDAYGRGELYNLAEDPAELCNLFDHAECADVRCNLMRELLVRALRAEDPLPVPTGYNERKTHPRNYWSDGD